MPNFVVQTSDLIPAKNTKMKVDKCAARDGVKMEIIIVWIFHWKFLRTETKWPLSEDRGTAINTETWIESRGEIFVEQSLVLLSCAVKQMGK